MVTKKQNAVDAQVIEEKGLTIQEPQSLDKPQQDTEFAHAAAKVLMDIVEQNRWAKRLGGDKAHLAYEAWQTAGKYYGYAVKTFDAEYIELGGTWGFKAKAVVVNEHTGVEVGSAEAYCMSDENNWRNKPKFQLASMAQTRAGSKALRQNLGFVVALAGYNPTPAEEMEGVHPEPVKQLDNGDGAMNTGREFEHRAENGNGNGHGMVSEKQIQFIKSLLEQKGYTEKSLMQKYDVTNMNQLTGEQASTIIENLMRLPRKK